jgi:hypothetical protein
VPDNSRIEMYMVGLLQRAKILKPAQVVKVDLAVVFTLSPWALRMGAAIQEPTVGIAPQLGERMQLEGDDLIEIFLLRKVAVYAVITDTLRQAMPLRAQLLLVEVDAGLFLILSCCSLGLAWRGLGDGEGESAPACHIHHRHGRNLHAAFRASGTTVEEMPKPEGLFPALGNKGGILSRDQLRARIKCRRQNALMKVRPYKGRPELARNRALGVVTVTTEIAPSDVPAQGKNCSKQHSQKLPLWLTDRRHLLQNVGDNCHRP